MSLTKVSEVVGVPCAQVCEVLESILADARAGRITSIICVYEYADGGSSHAIGWATATLQLLIGQMEIVKGKLLRRHLDEERA